MIDLTVWNARVTRSAPIAPASLEVIVLTGSEIQDFCDVLDRLATFGGPDGPRLKALVPQLRTATRLTGDPSAPAGDTGPHFGRMWTATYSPAPGVPTP
jgi:hypothetical protein